MQPLVSTDPRHIGDYRLEGVLGRGGQGSVYLGKNSSGTKVAVKVIGAQVATDQDARRRFAREAQTARRVAGFCTARVLDAGIAGDTPYIVSEYIAGQPLDALVRSEGVRSGSGLERLAVVTLTALAAIHRAGIVHRDFKPGNVIMGAEGPVVIDFGIARASGHTVTSSVIGTPAFMAPEQFEGGAVGPEVDLFSWAATMVFAATGRHAFAGDTTPAVMRAILDTEPDLTAVPATLRPLLEKCLVKDPRHRPNADEVLRWLTGEQTPLADVLQATTPPRKDTASTAGQPNLLFAMAAAAVMGVAVVLALMSMAFGSNTMASISLGLVFMSSPVLGAAVWNYHIGARIALCSTFPLGLVYAFWAIKEDWGYPDGLLVWVPLGLQAVAFAVTATCLRRIGKPAMASGVVAGAAIAAYAVGRSLDDSLPGVDFDREQLMVVAAIGAVSAGVWLASLAIALVRRTL